MRGLESLERRLYTLLAHVVYQVCTTRRVYALLC